MPAAFFFDPGAYSIEGGELVGRRAAGAAFLRAAIEGRGEEPLTFYAGRKKAFEQMAGAIGRIDSDARCDWIAVNQIDLLAKSGTMFRPDPVLTGDARLRLRAGPAAYSLCGITHSVSSSRAIEAIAQLVTEPVMPWDAVICTSTAALGVVQAALEAALDHHRWRMKLGGTPALPQFPIIPLGVHTGDFTPSQNGRRAARSLLGLAEDETAILFAGRLSISTKAHPFQMYEALRIAAARSGKRLVLIQAGQFYTEAAADAIRQATATHCTGVRALFVDGADAALYAASFQGADLFMSLSDNIQETFGITPVEAMASGLPVLVSDWNGYRDTVRDGIDGFRVATRAPAPGGGRRIAESYQTDGQYETYTSRASATVSMDMDQLVPRLTELVDNPDLRLRMGEAARARAVADYDWAVVYRRYRTLWAELGDRRRHALADPEQAAWLGAAPAAHPVHEDPYRIFAHYPTRTIGPATIIRTAPGATLADYERLSGEPIFELWRVSPALVGQLMAAADAGLTIAELAASMQRGIDVTIGLAARLAKMNLVLIEGEAGG